MAARKFDVAVRLMTGALRGLPPQKVSVPIVTSSFEATPDRSSRIHALPSRQRMDPGKNLPQVFD
jgi:hypothetical protein